MLSNILYGSAALDYGGIRLTALAGGRRGETVTLTVTLAGAGIVIVTTIRALGTGDIEVTAPVGTTEAQLVAALKAHATTGRLATVEQASGNGTALIAALVSTPFGAAVGGLRQFLQARLGIAIWEDRDRKATGKVVGFLEIFEAKIERTSLDRDGYDKWSGVVVAGLALQQDVDFESQNVTLDIFRRALFLATKFFTHPDLINIGPQVYGYTNELKIERAGSVAEGGRLELVGKVPIQWQEPAFDPDYEDEFPFDHFQIALWREPVDDVPGPGGGEVLDTVLTIEE